MGEKRLAVIIMLAAGTIIAFACIGFKVALVPSLLYISATLLFFYILGLIILSIISKINKEAEERAKRLKAEEDEEDEEESEVSGGNAADSEK